MAHPELFQDRRSIIEVLRDIAAHTEEIVRAEIQLGVAEVREEVTGLARRGAFLMVGAALGFLAVIMLLLSAVYALALVMPSWAAALTIGLVIAALAAVFMWKAARPSKEIEPVVEIGPAHQEQSWAIEKRS
jgi:uncharacterized membrane protein YqjE